MTDPFRLTTGDPRFNPDKPVTVNGYLYLPPSERRQKIVPGRTPKSVPTPTDPPKTLRDEFAMAALTGLLAHLKIYSMPSDTLARISYEQADAMMAERRKGGEA